MSNELQAPIQDDGSYSAAVASMPDIEELELATERKPNPEPAPVKAVEPKAEAKTVEPKEEPKADDKAVDPKKEEAPEDDDDWVEYAEEDGKEPTRAKLADVWAGYRETEKLKGELQTAKQANAPPLPERDQ